MYRSWIMNIFDEEFDSWFEAGENKALEGAWEDE